MSDQEIIHFIYTYHRASIDACDLIFHERKRDMSRIPDPYAEIVGLEDEYFTSETPFAIEQRLTVLLKLRQVDEPRP
jgi:hypothetical protein